MKFVSSEEIVDLHNHVQHFLEKCEAEDLDDPVIQSLMSLSDALFACRMARTEFDLGEMTIEWEDDIPMSDRVSRYLECKGFSYPSKKGWKERVKNCMRMSRELGSG